MDCREQVSWGVSLHSVRRRGGVVVVGWLEDHSLCGQEMETATATTDNLWFAVLWVGGWACGVGRWSCVVGVELQSGWVGPVEWVGGACGLVEWGLWSGWVGPMESVNGTVLCKVEKNILMVAPTKWHYCVCTIYSCNTWGFAITHLVIWILACYLFDGFEFHFSECVSITMPGNRCVACKCKSTVLH